MVGMLMWGAWRAPALYPTANPTCIYPQSEVIRPQCCIIVPHLVCLLLGL